MLKSFDLSKTRSSLYYLPDRVVIPVHITARVILLLASLAPWKTREFQPRREHHCRCAPKNPQDQEYVPFKPCEVIRAYARELRFASQNGQTGMREQIIPCNNNLGKSGKTSQKLLPVEVVEALAVILEDQGEAAGAWQLHIL